MNLTEVLLSVEGCHSLECTNALNVSFLLIKPLGRFGQKPNTNDLEDQVCTGSVQDDPIPAFAYVDKVDHHQDHDEAFHYIPNRAYNTLIFLRIELREVGITCDDASDRCHSVEEDEHVQQCLRWISPPRQ